MAEVADAMAIDLSTDTEMEEREVSAKPQPLEHAWAFWLDNTQAEVSGHAASGRSVHAFSTMGDFWSLYNNILHPSELDVGSDLYCLKNKIEPKRKGPFYANGGKWTISCGKGKSETLWLHTLMALVGEQFKYGDEICGAVLSLRGIQETVAIWTKDAGNEAAQSSISKQWKEFLDYKDSIQFLVNNSGTRMVQCWTSKFPQDPLDTIYNCVTDPQSHMRFAAVCRSWCATASRHPALPWLLLSPLPRESENVKCFYCPEGNQILRIPLLRGFGDHWFVGCHDGGWVASYEPPSFRIINLFSGFEVALSEKQKWIPRHGRLCQTLIWKLIFSKPPTSSDCILAAITDASSIALCKVGCPGSGSTTKGINLADIAFCNGMLYGLTRWDWKLVKFDIGFNETGAPVVTATDQPLVTIQYQQPHDYRVGEGDVRYIFALNGKLAMAERYRWLPNRRHFFRVFELVELDTSEGTAPCEYKWEEVTSLGDFTLFLSPNCSVAAHMPEDRRGGVRRNHIYYSNHDCLWRNEVVEDGVFLAWSNEEDCSMYIREDEYDSVEMISAVGYYPSGGPFSSMWLLPPDL